MFIKGKDIAVTTLLDMKFDTPFVILSKTNIVKEDLDSTFYASNGIIPVVVSENIEKDGLIDIDNLNGKPLSIRTHVEVSRLPINNENKVVSISFSSELKKEMSEWVLEQYDAKVEDSICLAIRPYIKFNKENMIETVYLSLFRPDGFSTIPYKLPFIEKRIVCIGKYDLSLSITKID